MSTAAPEPTTISLEEMAARYLDNLQRNYDMVSYTLAGSRKISEGDYDDFSQQLQVMPRQPARMPFDKAKQASEQWILRNSLADGLAIVMPVLEDARTICSLCDFKASGSQDQEELNEIASNQRADFLQQDIGKKFSILKERYQISCDVEEHILSLMEFTKALMMKDGILTKEEAADGEKRTLKIRSVQVVQSADGQSSDTPGSLNLTRRVGDSARDIKVGEAIHFSKAEHIGAILTIGIFVTDILRGIQAYAQSVGAAD
ncbi:MAG: hypothetical protein P1U86_07815 [Verrucomicrobiales bacterium]|nr:hypothetical protein [Verrucomicrobiales bacterium]